MLRTLQECSLKALSACLTPNKEKRQRYPKQLAGNVTLEGKQNTTKIIFDAARLIGHVVFSMFNNVCLGGGAKPFKSNKKPGKN